MHTSAWWKERWWVRDLLLSSLSSAPHGESLNLRHGKTADLSSFLYPQNGRSEEVARHSACISHVWTSQPPPATVTLFCPALQTDSGFFLFPGQCQQARHEHGMQILPWPGFRGNSFGSHPNSTAPCLLKLAKGHAHKYSAQTRPEQVSAGFSFSVCESF